MALELHLDATFMPKGPDALPAVPGTTNTHFYDLKPYGADRALIGVANDAAQYVVYAIDADGEVDPSFSPIVSDGYAGFFPASDDSILVTYSDGESDLIRNHLSDGTLDSRFTPYVLSPIEDYFTSLDSAVRDAATGRFTLKGEFRHWGGGLWGGYGSSPQLIQLNADGTEVSDFIGIGFGPFYSSVLLVGSNGADRVLVSGRMYVQIRGESYPEELIGTGVVDGVGELSSFIPNTSMPVATNAFGIPGTSYSVLLSDTGAVLYSHGNEEVVDVTSAASGRGVALQTDAGWAAAVWGDSGDLVILPVATWPSAGFGEAEPVEQHPPASYYAASRVSLRANEFLRLSPAGNSYELVREVLTHGAPPPPPGQCFWTDMVGVAEDCSTGPAPRPSGLADFWAPTWLGNGSGYGAVNIEFLASGVRSPYVPNEELFQALLSAGSVRLTGLAGVFNPPTGDSPDGADEGEVRLDENITWTDMDHEMTLLTWGEFASYYWYNDEPEGRNRWQHARITVDGRTFYGVVFIGDGV